MQHRTRPSIGSQVVREVIPRVSTPSPDAICQGVLMLLMTIVYALSDKYF